MNRPAAIPFPSLFADDSQDEDDAQRMIEALEQAEQQRRHPQQQQQQYQPQLAQQPYQYSNQLAQTLQPPLQQHYQQQPINERNSNPAAAALPDPDAMSEDEPLMPRRITNVLQQASPSSSRRGTNYPPPPPQQWQQPLRPPPFPAASSSSGLIFTSAEFASQMSNAAMESPVPPQQQSNAAAMRLTQMQQQRNAMMNHSPVRTSPAVVPPPAPLPPTRLPLPPPPSREASNSALDTLCQVEMPSLIQLFVHYFPSLHPRGVPGTSPAGADPNSEEDLSRMKRSPQFRITHVLSRFFHTHRMSYIGCTPTSEQEIRSASRICLDYQQFCTHVARILPGMESEMTKRPVEVLACLACALHHTCAHPKVVGVGTITALELNPPVIEFALPSLIVRLFNYRPLTPLKQAVRAGSLGTFVAIRGTVVRTSPTRPAVTRMDFMCSRCGTKRTVEFPDHLYTSPFECDEEKCRAKFSMEPQRITAQCIDMQMIKIQEIMQGGSVYVPPEKQKQNMTTGANDDEKSSDEKNAAAANSSSSAAASSASAEAAAANLEDQGRVPRTLEVQLLGADLVDSVMPGDIVSICGFVKSRKQETGVRGKNTSVFILYLEANSIVKASQVGDENERKMNEVYFEGQRIKREGGGIAKKEEPGTGDGASSSSSGGSTTPMPFLKQPSSRTASLDPSSEFSSNELFAIQQLAESSQTSGVNLLKMLVASICPSIFGHETIKAGLLLALLGGVTKHQQQTSEASASDTMNSASGSMKGDKSSSTGNSGSSASSSPMSVRGDIHVLVVGDPGLGKSQMLRAASRASPRGVYISGGVASKTGLTVTMVKDGKDGFALEAGALVLADQGCCCIDEFDKMTSEHNALLEAMEQQSISIAKAGMVCSLAARTSVIAAANPIGGHYNRGKTISENLKIGSPLLSRFDLVFIILDQPDQEKDQRLSEHIIQFHGMEKLGQRPPSSFPLSQPRRRGGIGNSGSQNSPSSTPSPIDRPLAHALVVKPDDSDVMWKLNEQGEMEVDLLPIPLLRKYLAYAKKYCKPLLSQGAKDVLSAYYLSLRRNSPGDSTPITTRQLEALIRLAEARAKADLREIVSDKHAQDVVNLMKESMRDVEEGGPSGSTGLWFDSLPSPSSKRANPRSSMSKSNLKKKFIQILRQQAQVKMDLIFTFSELEELQENAGMSRHIDDFGSFVESLNTENFLLRCGPKRYKLMTTMS